MTKITSETKEGNKTIFFKEKDYLFKDLNSETPFFEWVDHFEQVTSSRHKDETLILEDGWDYLEIFVSKVFKIQGLIETDKPLMDFIDEITENDNQIIEELHGDEVLLGYLDIIEFYKLEHDCLKIGELAE